MESSCQSPMSVSLTTPSLRTSHVTFHKLVMTTHQETWTSPRRDKAGEMDQGRVDRLLHQGEERWQRNPCRCQCHLSSSIHSPVISINHPRRSFQCQHHHNNIHNQRTTISLPASASDLQMCTVAHTPICSQPVQPIAHSPSHLRRPHSPPQVLQGHNQTSIKEGHHRTLNHPQRRRVDSPRNT